LSGTLGVLEDEIALFRPIGPEVVKLVPSRGWIGWPWKFSGYLAPESSAHVAMTSIKWPGCHSNSPRRLMPSGQWATNGVAMPPSWTKCLYSRKGVLETLAQPRPYAMYVSSGPGMAPGPVRIGQPARVCFGWTSKRIASAAIGGRDGRS
jgi:hypothetical protein